MRGLLSRLVVVLFFLGLFGGTSWAQISGSIEGTVQDSSGAAIPNVMVTVTNVETGTARTVTTDDRGYYQVLSLQVGQYQVSAEAQGFKKALRRGIDLTVGQQAVIPFSLEVGQVQEQVTVTAEVPVVDTTTASTSGLVEEKAVKDLPLNGRSYDRLITLNPGTSSVTTNLRPTAANVSQGYLFNVNGNRSNDNLFTVNGIEFTGASRIGAMPGGASGQLLGVDAVREFNVESSTYGVEYGKRLGGQVNIVTQSGTNNFHGTVFEFLRNDMFDATDFFTNAAGAKKPAFRRNDFGGAAGGPIRKDKTFIFGNYEAYRQRLTQTNVAIVPDNLARQGILPIGKDANGNPNGSLVNVGIAPGIAPYFAMYPVANGPELLTNGLPTGVADSFNSAGFPVREDYGNVRVDQYFSDKDSLSAAYTVDDGDKTTPFADVFSASVLAIRQQVLSLQETHTFAANTINTIRFGFSRASFFSDTTPSIPFDPSLSIVPGRPMGSVSIGGGGGAAQASSVSGFGNGDVNSHEHRNLFTYMDTVQTVRGKHQLNFGVWLQRVQQNSAGVEATYGSVTFADLQHFLQGQATTLAGGGLGDVVGSRQLEAAFYAQDTVRATNTLTVTVGLRYEPTNGWHEINGHAQDSVLGPNGLLVQQQPSGPLEYEVTGPTVMQNTSLKNFAPRLGLAWDIFGKGKTVVHAGFGTYYSELDDRNFRITASYPFSVAASFNSATFPQQLPVLPAYSPLPANSLVPSGGWVQNAKTPTVQEWSFSIEQQLTRSTGITVGYIGSHGYHLIDSSITNPTHSVICPDPACPQSPAAQLPAGTQYFPSSSQSQRLFPLTGTAGFWEDSGHSRYNALQVDARQQVTKGVNFRANFTWAKALDNSAFPVGGYSGNCPNTQSQAFNPDSDFGISCQDIKFRFSFNGGYALPIGQGRALFAGVGGVAGKLISGWQLTGIVTWQTGLPFSPLDGFNRSQDGNTGTPDRASYNPNFTGNLYPKTVGEWFDPNAFILSPLGTYGNTARNILRGPSLADGDVSLSKDTKFGERYNLTFRAEFFNILNHANFGLPNYSLFNSNGTRTGSGGVITTLLTDPREIQFGLKLGF